MSEEIKRTKKEIELDVKIKQAELDHKLEPKKIEYWVVRWTT